MGFELGGETFGSVFLGKVVVVVNEPELDGGCSFAAAAFALASFLAFIAAGSIIIFFFSS